MINHILKKDLYFCNNCYTEWEYTCNQSKAIAFDVGRKVKIIRKMTYHEICKETDEDALEQIPVEINKSSPKEVEDLFLSGWFSNYL